MISGLLQRKPSSVCYQVRYGSRTSKLVVVADASPVSRSSEAGFTCTACRRKSKTLDTSSRCPAGRVCPTRSPAFVFVAGNTRTATTTDLLQVGNSGCIMRVGNGWGCGTLLEQSPITHMLSNSERRRCLSSVSDPRRESRDADQTAQTGETTC